MLLGLEKSLWLIQHTLLQIGTSILITQSMFNEKKQESRARGEKFLFLVISGTLDDSIDLE